MALPKPVQRLVAQLTKLPGVGEKTATRYVLFWLRRQPEAMMELAQCLEEVSRTVRVCSDCGFLATEERCEICADEGRDKTTICVVETAADVIAVERAGEYRGLYHVLGGVISALRGVSPEQLPIDRLVERVRSGQVKEVILATGASAEGETTALYIAKVLAPCGVRITRPATGIPMGSSIEFLDALTLTRALRGRKEVGA